MAENKNGVFNGRFLKLGTVVLNRLSQEVQDLLAKIGVIEDNSVSEEKLTPETREKLNREMSIPDNSVTEPKLAEAVRTKLNKEVDTSGFATKNDLLSYLPRGGNSSSNPVTGTIYFKNPGNDEYNAQVRLIDHGGDEAHFRIETNGILDISGKLEIEIHTNWLWILANRINVGTATNPTNLFYNDNEVVTEKTLESYLKKNDIYSGTGVMLGTDSSMDWAYISPEEMNALPVSIGNKTLLRRIMFVKDGMFDWDAATVGQLKKKVGVVFSAYKQLSTSGTDIFTFDEGKILRMWRGNPSNLADILYIGVRNSASTNSYNTVEYAYRYQAGSSSASNAQGTISATTSTSAAFSTSIPSTNSYAEIMLFMSTSTARTTTSRYRLTINCFSTAGLCWITIEKLS